MNKLKHPDMREELIQHLFALSDADYQYRVLVLGGADEKTGTIHDEFDYAVHFFITIVFWRVIQAQQSDGYFVIKQRS